MIYVERGTWLEFTTKASKEELIEYVGEKCATYSEGCCVCDQHKLWEETGTMKILTDVEALVHWSIAGGDLDYIEERKEAWRNQNENTDADKT